MRLWDREDITRRIATKHRASYGDYDETDSPMRDDEMFKDELDQMFYDYALNEKSFPRFTPAQKEKAKANYGGVDGVVGGVIYSGGRIETREELAEIKSLVNGGTIKVNMKSFSHFRSTARAFANFVMTYNSMVGQTEMERALRRGSAGEFGTYILHAKADPKTILFNTRRKNGVTRSAEDELIVDGVIEIVKTELFEPLTRDNWESKTIDTWTNIRDLDDQTFLVSWLEHHEINAWPAYAAFLSKAIRSVDDLVFVINEHTDMFRPYWDEFQKWMERSRYAKALAEMIEPIVVNNDIKYKYKGKEIWIGKSISRLVLKRRSDQAIEAYNQSVASLRRDMNNIKESSFFWKGMTHTFTKCTASLYNLKSAGVLQKSHFAFVREFVAFMQQRATAGLTPDNWRDQKDFLDALAVINLSFLHDLNSTEFQRVLNAIRMFGKQMYEASNKIGFMREWGDEIHHMMDEIADIARAAVQLMAKRG